MPRELHARSLGFAFQTTRVLIWSQLDERTAAKYPDSPVLLEGSGGSVYEMKKDPKIVREEDTGSAGGAATTRET